jgi:hypothetical protein
LVPGPSSPRPVPYTAGGRVQNLFAITDIKHPNIVKFIDFVEEDMALVMEFIDGMSGPPVAHGTRPPAV